MTNRFAVLSDALQKQNLDAVFITSPDTISHLTNFHGFSETERDAYMLVTPQKPYLFTSALYLQQVVNTVTGITVHELSREHPLTYYLENLRSSHEIKTLGFDAENLTVSEWHRIQPIFPQLHPFSLSGLRIIKSPDEIDHIVKACAISDTSFQKVVKKIHPGMTEKELIFQLEHAFRKQGAGVAFPTIVAFGKNAASPHHHSNETMLGENDTILIDFGARVHGYNADITRTLFIGSITKQHRDMYTSVRTAQQKAAAYISKQLAKNMPVVAEDVDAVAREYLIEKGYPSFPHALGHGIGLLVHEEPRIAPGSQEILRDGMVFSLEPGIYLPGRIGIRIEDLYTIRDSELIQLTHSSSELTTL